jgi:hypothetical protein
MKYYVNKVRHMNGDHEVHEETCNFMPNTDNRKYLGDFSSCRSAVIEARKTYITANGCKTCSPSCYTT